jgi:hypothetical protein
MSSTQESPTLIQYACERCKTRFVLPPSSRKLSLAGKLRAFSIGVGRTFRHHEGLGAGYDSARRQLLAKMDDEAYQSFVQSFRFCHECRQFVCNECWSTSRRSCLTCVAKSMTGTVRPRPPFAPTGPEIPRPALASGPVRKGRLRRDIALAALAVAIVLLSIEGGVLLVEATSGPNTPAEKTIYVAVATDTASSAPTATTSGMSSSATHSAGPKATPTPTAAPTPTPTAAPTPTPTRTATPSPTETPIPTASLTPTQRPAPTLPPKPRIRCNHVSVTTSQGVTCTWTNNWRGTETVRWNLTGPYGGLPGSVPPPYNSTTWANGGGPGPYSVQLEVIRGSVDRLSNVGRWTVTP